MQLNEFSFKSRDTDENVLLMCQKMDEVFPCLGNLYSLKKNYTKCSVVLILMQDTGLIFILMNWHYTTTLFL